MIDPAGYLDTDRVANGSPNANLPKAYGLCVANTSIMGAVPFKQTRTIHKNGQPKEIGGPKKTEDTTNDHTQTEGRHFYDSKSLIDIIQRRVGLPWIRKSNRYQGRHLGCTIVLSHQIDGNEGRKERCGHKIKL